MKFQIKHEKKGRMRVQFLQKSMSFEEADYLQYYLESKAFVTSARIHENVCTATISFTGDREKVIHALRRYRKEQITLPQGYSTEATRELNQEYKEKLVRTVLCRAINKLLIPVPIRNAWTAVKSVRYIKNGLIVLAQKKLEVPVLDGTAIGVSMARGEFDTASSIMFLLGIGEILEEWTHKKSVTDLARSMSLNVSNVWLKTNGQEVLVPVTEIHAGDEVVVRMGTVIPFDGSVTEGSGMVNQSSLTGESMPVHKETDGYVYAGTVLEEGELTVQVRETAGSSKYEKIIQMIEDTEKLKSSLESKAEHLADRLVPYSFVGTGLVWLLTRNATKALSILMVDFSCALKLAMPVSVLSAIREAGNRKVTVKGGKYLEAVAEADTIVFDKTGTLTKAKPTVAKIISFGKESPDELLRTAACLEEHFPHSVAKAVVEAAEAKNLKHREMHTKVEYMVAHGIVTMIGDTRVIIGSYHFLMEDEHCQIPEDKQELFDSIPEGYSYLYMAFNGKLAAVLCIEDPLREEAVEVLRLLREEGITNIVMMTGDSDRTARAIAAQVGVDACYSEVLPEDKAKYVKEQKALGHKVIMVGDGVNDSPALSAADVGIAISEGAEIAREIADITVGADNLYQLVALKQLSNRLMNKIRWNYRTIVGFNTGLIVLGVAGVLQPTTSALLHNTSTLAIGVKSLGNLL